MNAIIIRPFQYTTVIALYFVIAFSPSWLSASERPYLMDYGFPGSCDDAMLDLQCAETLEAQFAGHRALLPREDNGELCLSTREPPECVKTDNSVRYLTVDRFLEFFLLVEFWSGNGESSWDILLVSQQSELVARLVSYPVLNNSRKYFATARFDIDAGYRPNIVEIWDADDLRRPKYTLDEFPSGYGPISVQWNNDETLLVNLRNLEEDKKQLKLYFDDKTHEWKKIK